MNAGERLSFYTTKFDAVEIDSIYYGTPTLSTVQVITHEKVLLNCYKEFTEFVKTMAALDEKLGPLLPTL